MPIHLLSDGTFKLDGGAMHGVVPRSLWEKQNPPDEKNRILLGLNCLYIEQGPEKILVESGIGTGHSEKFVSLYEINKTRSIQSELQRLGVSLSDITTVIVTHLHFDHGGGLANWKTGELLFPKARLIVQESEWEAAMQPHPKNQASYLPEFLTPLKKAKLELIQGEKEIAPGIKVFKTGGHTHGHQAVFIQSEGKIFAYLGDLIPTAAHINPLWTMAYDVAPEQSISMKQTFLREGLSKAWIFVLVHEPAHAAGTVKQENKKWMFSRTITIEQP